MIEIYTYLPDEPGLIRMNDAYFDKITFRDLSMDQAVAEIIKEIDGSEVISEDMVKTPFGGMVFLTELSTGCKTAINVYKNPKSLVSCEEAGDNAVEVIIRNGIGRIYLPYLPLLWNDIDTEIEFHSLKYGILKFPDYQTLYDEMR
ncbi:MAG: DUF4869 domain-containing protein [Lachnospiraceae bacterium]|nr:DUF4869 domain-containing protein [Lachnospiraceae bacterium]